MKVGIIGFGRLGKLISKYLEEDFTVEVYDINQDVKEEVEALGCRFKSLDEVCKNPIVIPFVPMNKFESVIKEIAPKLSKDAAMFHFMSGYTSKLAGTERGVKEPKATFSKCFGAPFMPRPASVYAEMLGEKISKHNTSVYLINTGWSGGPYGVGKRIKIEYSRAMVTAVINGSLDIVKFSHNDLFNLDVPTECPGVPSEVLEPRNTWVDKDSYDLSAKKLAQMFVDNFKKFKDASEEIRSAGPKL